MRLVIVALLLVPIARADELQSRLERLARDLETLRSETRLVQERSKLLERALAKTELRVAELREADGSALGATRIEKLRQDSAALVIARNLQRELLRRRFERVEARIADAEAISRSGEPRRGGHGHGTRPLLQDRIDLASLGNATARAYLKTLRARLVKQVPGIVQGASALRSPLTAHWGNAEIVAQGRVVRLVNGNFFRLGSNRPPKPSPKPTPKSIQRVVSPEERKQGAEQDREQQQQRARRLEAQMSALAGKIAALEEQLGRARAKVANSPPR